MNEEDKAKIAEVAHEVNAAYCRSIGDHSQPSWELSQDWVKNSALNGVEYHLNNQDVTPRQSHENWLSVKRADGWVYGPVKDPELKEHPCMVEYDDLPTDQKTKDYLFKAVVDTMRQFY